jgi:DNA-binding protein H-NS
MAPTAGKILEHSQRSLEKVQKTVDKATHDIHQTINEKLSDLKTLEKQLSKSNLLEHDANNNDVEKTTKGTISRHSTKLDMSEQSTSMNTGTTTTDKSNLKQSTMMMDKDRISVNAISAAPGESFDDEGEMSRTEGLQHQESDESKEMDSSTR